MTEDSGLLLVISGPSGVGKGTVCDYLKTHRDDIYLSVSATSRLPRNGEAEGVNYFFKTDEEFKKMIAENEFLEYATYVNCSYGTPKKPCMENLKKGKNVILEIEIQGGLQVKSNYPDTVMIFMVPPSADALEQRLRGRGTEAEDKIEKRLERAMEEFEYMDKYDYIIVNDTVENAADKINAVISAEKSKRKNLINKIKEELGL